MKYLYLFIFFILVSSLQATQVDSQGRILPNSNWGDTCKSIYYLMKKDTVPVLLERGNFHSDPKKREYQLLLCPDCTKEKLHQYMSFESKLSPGEHVSTTDNDALKMYNVSDLQTVELFKNNSCLRNRIKGVDGNFGRQLFKDNICVKKEIFYDYLNRILKFTPFEVDQIIKSKNMEFIDFYQVCYNARDRDESTMEGLGFWVKGFFEKYKSVDPFEEMEEASCSGCIENIKSKPLE